MTTKKHNDEHEHVEAAAAAPKTEAAPAPFPFTGSINEPQTVSLPLPQGTVVPKPSITSIEPDTCAIGDPDFTLVITGENFFDDSVINFAGHDEPTTLEADGTLTTGVKPSLWTEPVTVGVLVKNGPEVSNAFDFDFTVPGAVRSSKHKRK
jgi:hypothetical protein